MHCRPGMVSRIDKRDKNRAFTQTLKRAVKHSSWSEQREMSTPSPSVICVCPKFATTFRSTKTAQGSVSVWTTIYDRSRKD